MTTTSLTVREAAAATGLSRQGILKAINTGRLSAQRHPEGSRKQQWVIEPVELSRVFTLHSTNGDNQNAGNEAVVVSGCQQELESLHEKVAFRAEQP